MNIGFDAKRAYINSTGLGHYSRTLISSLAQQFPQHNYYLFTPKITERFNHNALQNTHAVAPTTFPSTLIKSAWRSRFIVKDLLKNNIELYHGLSHEIPAGIATTAIKTVVTMHDLIFERYPQQYNPIDVFTYRRKLKYACKHADKIIAISHQTKNDLIEFYKADANKIEVCYQSCNPVFYKKHTTADLEIIRKKYNLPQQYYLYVGSIIQRKNLLNLVKAIHFIKDKITIPLLVIGGGTMYKKQVIDYVSEHDLSKHVIFLSDSHMARSSPQFQSAQDFPAIYSMAKCMVYPSIFEGFGIPVLEALAAGTPVITSNVSCLPEAGGDAAYYINPFNIENIAEGLLTVLNNDELRKTMVVKGYSHAANFTNKVCADNVMEVYKQVKGEM